MRTDFKDHSQFFDYMIKEYKGDIFTPTKKGKVFINGKETYFSMDNPSDLKKGHFSVRSSSDKRNI